MISLAVKLYEAWYFKYLAQTSFLFSTQIYLRTTSDKKPYLRNV